MNGEVGQREIQAQKRELEFFEDALGARLPGQPKAPIRIATEPWARRRKTG